MSLRTVIVIASILLALLLPAKYAVEDWKRGDFSLAPTLAFWLISLCMAAHCYYYLMK